MHACTHTCAQCLWRSEDGTQVPEIAVTDGWLWASVWELNLCSLEEQ